MKTGDDPKDVFLYDTQLQGLGCKITAGGKVSFFVERRFGGKKNIRKKIGEYPSLSLDAARQQATIVLAQIANGVDVSREKRESRAVQLATLNSKTFAQLYGEYWDRHNDGKRYRHEQQVMFNRVVGTGYWASTSQASNQATASRDTR
jgi:hypothetical protein